MKILYLTNVPSPYRVEYFNILSNYCELTVLYEKSASDERDNKWVANNNGKYQIEFLPGISTGVDKSINLKVIKHLKNKYDYIVICGVSSPSEIIAIEFCKIHRIDYFIEGDGGIAKSGKGVKERFKKILIKNANGYFSTCKRHDIYYLTYGARKDRIYRYPFSSVCNKDILDCLPSIKYKNQLREKLGISEKKIVLSVGQFIHRKGFDLLMKAATNIKEVGFYIVGGKPTKTYLDFKAKYSLSNVHFVGFKTKQELIEYYDSADMFVLPTREDIWGLVVNEAMARGLPVITTKNCNAGLEMIKNGVNGLLIEPDNIRELTLAIKRMIECNNIKEMGKAALDTAQNYTLEKMAERHIEVFENKKKEAK